MSSGAVAERTNSLGLAILNFGFPNWGDEANNNQRIIDAAFAYFGVTISGAWSNSTNYTAGQLVVDPDENALFRVMVTHTSAASGSFLDDRTAHPTYWDEAVVPFNARGAWTTATAYNANDIAYEGYKWVIAVQAHTSAALLATDITNGKMVVIMDGTSTVADSVSAKNAAQAAAVLTAADAASADADAIATAADRVAVAADKVTVAADKATVSADKGTVAADKATVAADKAIVAADKGTVASDKAAAAASAVAAAASAATAASTANDPGFIYNVTTANDTTDPTNDISFSGGGMLTLTNGTLFLKMATPVAARIKQLDVAWAAHSSGPSGGRMSAAAITNTTYHCFALYNPTSGLFDWGFDVSATAPTLPSGYTYYCYVGPIMRSGGAIRPYTQYKDVYKYTTPIADRNSTAAFSDALQAFSVPLGLNVQPILSVNYQLAGGGTSMFCSIGDGNSATANVVVSRGSAGSEWNSNVFDDFFTDTSARLRLAVTNIGGTSIAVGQINTLGFKHTLGRL